MSRHTIVAVLLAATVLLADATAHAAAIRRLDVESERDCHRIFSITYIDAAPDAVFALLTDYEHFERISDIYKESGFLEPDPRGRPVVYTRMEACLLFFCKSMTRVEVLEAREPWLIRTTVLPERSDALYGRSEWTLEPEGHGTVVVYRATIRPSFELPPVVGPWLLQKRLRAESVAAAERMEEIANALKLRPR
jgi:Polyketide cyclase / dehydrase and lipid transport